MKPIMRLSNIYSILKHASKALAVATYLCISNIASAQTIDILFYSKHATEEDAYLGIIDGLKQSGYSTEKGLIINMKNANADADQLQSIAKTSVSGKPNVIIAATTSVAQAVFRETKEIPVIFAGVTDPLMAKLLTNLEAPENNVTGVTDFVPVESQLKFIQEIIPSIKRIGVVYTPTSDSSLSAQMKLIKTAKVMGVEIVGGAASNLLDIETSTQYLIDNKVDALYIPSDDKIILHADTIIKVALANKIPVFAADDESVNKGAVAGISYNYTEIGVLAGKMAAKILKGEKISSMSVAAPNKFQTFVNPKAAEQFNIKIPDSILKNASAIIK